MGTFAKCYHRDTTYDSEGRGTSWYFKFLVSDLTISDRQTATPLHTNNDDSLTPGGGQKIFQVFTQRRTLI